MSTGAAKKREPGRVSIGFFVATLAFGLIALAIVLIVRRKNITSRRRTIFAMSVAIITILLYGSLMEVKGQSSGLADVPPAISSGQLYHFHNDYIGRPYMITAPTTGGTNDVLWYADYYPFGEIMYESGSITLGDLNTTGLSWRPKFRFPGQYEDEETGMYYNWNRYYMPETGRYNRVDQKYYDDIAMKNQIYINQLLIYPYATNNPLVINDFNGNDINCGCANFGVEGATLVGVNFVTCNCANTSCCNGKLQKGDYSGIIYTGYGVSALPFTLDRFNIFISGACDLSGMNGILTTSGTGIQFGSKGEGFSGWTFGKYTNVKVTWSEGISAGWSYCPGIGTFDYIFETCCETSK